MVQKTNVQTLKASFAPGTLATIVFPTRYETNLGERIQQNGTRK